MVKKWKPQKNTSSLLFYLSFSFRTPWFLKKSCLIWRFFRDHCNGSEWHDRKINMKEILFQMVCHGSGPYSSQFWNLKFKLRVFGIPMGILQLTKVLQWFATHFWGYRSKSGVSVWEITLEIAGMLNRIADNLTGVYFNNTLKNWVGSKEAAAEGVSKSYIHFWLQFG